MIKALIIDDEQNSIDMLEWLLKTYCPDVEILHTCNSAEEGIHALRKHEPDIVFLDIEMPKMNGFDMLEAIGTPPFEIVFITAYDHFAVRAFRYAALNYLLKPVDPDELMKTIQRLKEKKSSPSGDQLQLLFQNLLNKENKVDRIALSTGDGLVFVQTRDICYCQAESNYTRVVMADGQRMMVARTLKDIDDTLAGKDFFRVHHSYLVNINHISRFVKGDGGYIVMPDKTEITIARSKRDDFFRLFARF
ncbi:MAG TPA: LytTR family DNA-binding domain-containing protein [Chitinophagaceae bacterium]|nr:LytTR family DNA-binding domain-containing protein [Chitinophagaceae bacterium]HNF70833.1 LytTR family DNA-binding domain-containing protein [Chitinophagaceae bacterium]